MGFNYDKFEKVNGYIYFYKNGKIVGVYNPFVGLRMNTSALRQYLNSDAAIGAWWTAQDAQDIAPTELTTKPGFLSGFGEDFINAIKTVKLITCGGQREIFDRHIFKSDRRRPSFYMVYNS